VGSIPADRARPEGEWPYRAASASMALQICLCESIDDREKEHG
jgi:hypothetical protein